MASDGADVLRCVFLTCHLMSGCSNTSQSWHVAVSTTNMCLVFGRELIIECYHIDKIVCEDGCFSDQLECMVPAGLGNYITEVRAALASHPQQLKEV